MQQACGRGAETAMATGTKIPDEQKHKQQSGGQAMHGQATNAGHKHRGRKAARKFLPSIRGAAAVARVERRYGSACFKPCSPHERDALAYIGLAIYFISTQRPPPVNTITRFITTNIRS